MTIEEKKAIVAYRINRARETINEVEFQIAHKKWNTAGNRLYYACYYAVTALLVWYDIAAKSHSGARQMFALHFIKPGIIPQELGDAYTDIFELRQTGDYDDFIIFDAEKVEALLPFAQQLIDQIGQILASETGGIS